MKPQDFVTQYLPFALTTEQKTGIHHAFTLAQAALETGWSKSVYGNMFFGVKARPMDKNRQLLRTTEYSSRSDLQFPEIISITQVAPNRYKYIVKDWFRAYNTPEESFTDHANFLLHNHRYEQALAYRSDPKAFAQAVADAGYATDPNYAGSLIKIIDKVLGYIG